MKTTTTTTTRPRLKNSWGKTRPIDNPYLTVISGDWEFRVLKAYQSYANEYANPLARWYTAVRSPFTHGTFEYGDTYVRDIVPYLKKTDTSVFIERGLIDSNALDDIINAPEL